MTKVDLSELTQRDFELAEIPPPRPVISDKLTVDTLWRLRELADEERKDLSRYIGMIDAELERRVLTDNPGFGPEDGGGRDLTGERVLLTMTYSRTYADPDDETVQRVLASEALTPAESNKLVNFKAVIDGRFHSTLMRRGGAIAEAIAPLRMLRGARPVFTAKERK